jgi:putative spermidine/putrescine transport system permease protein
MQVKFSKVIVLTLGIIFLFPFVFFLWLSLAREWRYPSFWPEQFSTDAWKLMFSAQSGILGSFGVSFLISAIVAMVSTAAGYFCSKFIAYHPYKNILLSLSYGTYILSPVIYAAIIYYFFILLNLTGTKTGVIAGQFIVVFPFALVFFSSFWNSHLKLLEQLVSTLGGNRWQRYSNLLLPLSKNILLVCFFQTFLISWFEYGLTSFIGAGKVSTLTLKVFEYVQEANPNYAALSSFLLVIPPLVLLWANKRFIFTDDSLLK